MYDQADQIKQLIDYGKRIVVVQADNPDADSLGSALAMEHILGDLGKDVYLYCAVDMPSYLHYLSGWDRVNKDLASQFDLSIIVDASTLTLIDKLITNGQKGWLASKPCIVLDHHESVEKPVDFATVTINDSNRASTGELIYIIAKQLEWPVSLECQEVIASSILGDTQGLSNSLASAQTYRIMADMIEAGVDRPRLEELRREFGKMQPEIYKYKAKLIERTEFALDGRLAIVTVPQDEINTYSPLYNPAPLVQSDMLQTRDVEIAVVLKNYDDGHVTAAIRCNPTAGVAAKLAEHFGGGGHAFASGFKVTDGRKLDALKKELIEFTGGLLK